MTAVLLPNGKQQYFTTAGLPAVGYKVATFDAGTSNPRITWLDALKVAQNTNPVILDARGEASIFWEGAYKVQLQDSTGAVIWTQDNLQSQPNGFTATLVPGVTNSVDLGSAAFTWRNGYFGTNVLVGPNNTPVLETTTGNIGYYKRTAAEIAAGVVPVNFSYPPMYVDRYGTNTTPGTTSMAAAFQAAINTMRNAGGVLRYGATAPYLIDTALDCTFGTSANQFGLNFREEGNTSQDTPSIIFKHLGYGFDLTGCDAYTFYDCTIGTDGTIFPQVCFFQARANVAGSNSQLPRILHTKVQGKFSKCIQYNYASEDGVYVGNYWTNTYTGAAGRVAYITANNILGLTSSFVTIRTGAQSCIDHQYIGGQYVMLSSDVAADVFYFDNCSHVKMFGPWVGCNTGAGVGGRSIIFVDMTNGAASHIHLSALQVENASPQQTYGILFSNVAGTPTQWHLYDCYIPAATNAISAPALVILDSFFVTQLKQVANNGITCTNMQNSTLHIETALLTISGTSTSNFIVGSSPNITIGIRVKTVVVDTNSGNIQTNGVIGLLNQTPPASVAGFGVPTGAAVVANFPGATATLLQTSQSMAQVLTILKNIGFITA